MYIPDHPYGILIIGGSGAGKTNALLSLINNQPDIDKIYLYAKDPYEAKYQLLINKRENVGLDHFNNPNTFIQYSNNMHSAAFRWILVPFEQYWYPKKCAQKVLVALFPYIFLVKAKRNIVYEYLKTQNLSRDTNITERIEHQISVHWTSNNFGHSAATIGGFRCN